MSRISYTIGRILFVFAFSFPLTSGASEAPVTEEQGRGAASEGRGGASELYSEMTFGARWLSVDGSTLSPHTSSKQTSIAVDGSGISPGLLAQGELRGGIAVG